MNNNAEIILEGFQAVHGGSTYMPGATPTIFKLPQAHPEYAGNIKSYGMCYLTPAESYNLFDTDISQYTGFLWIDNNGESVQAMNNVPTKQIRNALLHEEYIAGTTQTIAFDSAGNVQSITHKDGSDNTVRTDVFTFAANSITETRTLSTGESLTIVTNLTTLETTITYAAA